MALIGGTVAYKVLHHFWPTGETHYLDGSAYKEKSKLEVLLGADVWSKIAGKVVIDFGCGVGTEAIEMAQRGERRSLALKSENLCLLKQERQPALQGYRIAANLILQLENKPMSLRR